MKTPLISVLIPTYNRATTLEQCVRSAQVGGHEQLEIIISDNGSTDGTQAVAQRLADEDKRIVLLLHEVNGGPIANWSACLKQASGELVHWLWSDDWVEPNFYAIMLARMPARNGNMVICAAKLVEPISGIWQIVNSMPDEDTSCEELMKFSYGMNRLPVSPAAALLPIASVRRYFINNIPKVSGLDCNSRAIGCDAIMIMGSIRDSRTVVFCPEPLVNFRRSNTSISCATDGKLLAAHYSWARIYWGRSKGLPFSWMQLDFLRLIRDLRIWAIVYALFIKRVNH